MKNALCKFSQKQSNTNPHNYYGMTVPSYSWSLSLNKLLFQLSKDAFLEYILDDLVHFGYAGKRSLHKMSLNRMKCELFANFISSKKWAQFFSKSSKLNSNNQTCQNM